MSKQTITATTLEGSHVCVPEAQFEAFIAAWERANSTCVWQQDGEGRPITKTDQVRMCGNSVCPPLAAALVSAQFNEQRQRRWA